MILTLRNYGSKCHLCSPLFLSLKEKRKKILPDLIYIFPCSLRRGWGMETAHTMSLVGSQTKVLYRHSRCGSHVPFEPSVSCRTRRVSPVHPFLPSTHLTPAQDPLQPPGWEMQAQGLAGSAPAPPSYLSLLPTCVSSQTLLPHHSHAFDYAASCLSPGSIPFNSQITPPPESPPSPLPESHPPHFLVQIPQHLHPCNTPSFSGWPPKSPPPGHVSKPKLKLLRRPGSQHPYSWVPQHLAFSLCFQ